MINQESDNQQNENNQQIDSMKTETKVIGETQKKSLDKIKIGLAIMFGIMYIGALVYVVKQMSAASLSSSVSGVMFWAVVALFILRETGKGFGGSWYNES